MARYLFLLLFCCLFINTAQAQTTTVDNNEEKFFTALALIEGQHYAQARTLLERVAAKHPLAPAAQLIIVDTFARGKSNDDIGNALDGYYQWLKDYPDHRLVPQVMFKTAETHLRLRARHHIDNAITALKMLEKLIARFPEYQNDDRVVRYIATLQELLGRHDLLVAKFYLQRRDNYQAARARCLDILEKYPQFSQLDSVLWILGNASEALAQEQHEDPQIAYQYYQQLLHQFPASQYHAAVFDKLLNAGINVSLPPNNVVNNSTITAPKLSSPVWEPLEEFRDIPAAGVLVNDLDRVDTAVFYQN